MPHLTDVLNAAGTVRFGPLSDHPAGYQASLPIINIPLPGDVGIGGSLGGIITQIMQRIPIPRPRLPLPRVPGPTGPRGRIPIPIPIPVPEGWFPGMGGNGCATDACCKGQHLDKQTGTKCVSNRRMNPLNPRALKRAIRRATRFEAFVKSNRKSLRSLARI